MIIMMFNRIEKMSLNIHVTAISIFGEFPSPAVVQPCTHNWLLVIKIALLLMLFMARNIGLNVSILCCTKGRI